MEPYPYTLEFYYSRGRKDRLEGRKYRPGQYDGWQGRAYKDGWEQALTRRGYLGLRHKDGYALVRSRMQPDPR